MADSDDPPIAEELQALRDVLVGAKALPVLFVGSGMSRRYIGSPDWDGLLEQFADLTGRPISYYRGRAGSDQPQIATLIAEQFYEIWFRDPEYADSRASFQQEVEHEADPLKFEVAKSISGLPLLDEPSSQAELAALSQVRVHAVVTTNWDTVLEDALRDLDVFVGQQDVLFTTTQAVGEIYKIHGSVVDPKSIILTSSDYEQYWDRNPYLIAKLLTMLVEHPVMFLGYSLSDPHIHRMLANLITCLTSEQIDVLNDRLIFVRRPKADERGSLTRGSITVGPHTLSIREFVCSDFTALYEELGKLPQTFPVKLLRQLRESVYELTFSTEPAGRVHVLPMDNANLDDVEIVIGVGALERLGERGYRALSRVDLFRDMLSGVADHHPEHILGVALPRLFRGAKYAPIYYPLLTAGRIAEDGSVVDTEGLPANARALLSGATPLQPYAVRNLAAYRSKSFREVIDEDPVLVCEAGLVCTYEIADVIALQKFLVEQIGDSDSIATERARLCCKYDRLVYGPDFAGSRADLHNALGIDPEWTRKLQRPASSKT